MNRIQLIRLIDLASFIGLCGLMSTGLLIKFTLPPKSGGAAIWGLTRHEWGNLHFYISIAFLIVLTVHLLLHLKFIKAAILGKAPRETRYRIAIGAIGMFTLLVFLVSPYFSPVAHQGERAQEKPHAWRNK